MHAVQAAAPHGIMEAAAADGGPVLLEADSPKRQKAGSVPAAAAVRSWTAAEDTSDDDFD